MAEVERMATLYPEIKEELDAITETLSSYAKLHAIEPPAHLKEKVLSKILSDPNSDNTFSASNNFTTSADITEAKQIRMPVEPEVNSDRKESGFSWWAVAASVLLLISAGLNFYFYNNWQNTENQYQLALASQNQYAQQVRQVNQKLELTNAELAVITHTKTQKVNLKGLQKSPASAVVVFWNPNTKDVLLKVADLPTPPAGKQYQLWALENGKTVDAGMLEVNPESAAVQKMKIINKA